MLFIYIFTVDLVSTPTEPVFFYTLLNKTVFLIMGKKIKSVNSVVYVKFYDMVGIT